MQQLKENLRKSGLYYLFSTYSNQLIINMEDLKVCTHRPGMKYNYVLDQPDVGQAKIPLCRLPALCFTYGSPRVNPDGSVKEALCNWYQNEDNKKMKDYSKGRVPLIYNSKFQYERTKLNKIPDISFGDRSGTPEDIKPVMCYGYQHMMIEKMKHKEAIRREKIREREERIASRRRVILRVNPKDTITEGSQTLWKMKKFENVKAKVSSKRNGN